jgi:hypothetical protein
MVYPNRRRRYTPDTGEERLSATDEARIYNTQAAQVAQQIAMKRKADLIADEDAKIQASLESRKKEALAQALGIPLREKYFNESLGVESTRPVQGAQNIGIEDLQSRFQQLPGYEQERIARSGAAPDSQKMLAKFQDEREKGILSQVGAFSQDLASGKIFHQKTASGNFELMQMAEDPNATDEDRLLGKVKKVPVPISMGQKALFIEAMRRKALPEGMDAFKIEGLNAPSPTTSPSQSQAATVSDLESAKSGMGVLAIPGMRSNLMDRVRQAIPEGRDLSKVPGVIGSTMADTASAIGNRMVQGVHGVMNLFQPKEEEVPFQPVFPQIGSQDYMNPERNRAFAGY